MRIAEAARTGYLEISSHKMRSFLSFSAIAFGVASILYTFAQVHHMFEERDQAVALAGPGRLEVRTSRAQKPRDKRGLSRGLTYQDAQAIRATMPDLYMVAPMVEQHLEFRYGDFSSSIRLHGVVPEWAKRDWAYTQRGRILDDRDVASAARVCMLVLPGGWSDEEHKPFWAKWWTQSEFDKFIVRNDLLGKTVQLKGQLFTVVGVLKNPFRDKDPRWFTREWVQVYVPLTSAQRYLAGSGDSSRSSEAIEQIQIDSGSEESFAGAKRRIEALLDSLHRGEKDYELEDFREQIQNQLSEMRKEAVAILTVGIIAILAGGVGIMNVTLATIFSRIREIGIRRALGATRGDILIQFVTEAVMLGLLGGAAGTLLGLAGLRWLGEGDLDKIRALQWWHFLATLGIAGAAGFLFSLYPAYQASKLDPVEALRHE